MLNLSYQGICFNHIFYLLKKAQWAIISELSIFVHSTIANVKALQRWLIVDQGHLCINFNLPHEYKQNTKYWRHSAVAISYVYLRTV